jgi:ABC-2 type transport system permease protein
MNALPAEFKKQKHSPIVWVTFAAFALAPLMGAMFMILARHPEYMAQTGMLRQKVELFSFTASWDSYLWLLTQAMGVGGVLMFGFVASWIFGREYTDRTATDLLALPTSRNRILNAKYLTYLLWCVSLGLSNILVGFIIGWLLQIDGMLSQAMQVHFGTYLLTTLLTIAVCAPVSFFAMRGRGYLAPLGFTAVIIFLAQVIAAVGVGHYFPWSIPALFSGAAGELKEQLNNLSYAIVIVTALAGYFSTRLWWNKADQA